jgi:hypothetical protein
MYYSATKWFLRKILNPKLENIIGDETQLGELTKLKMQAFKK